MQELTQKILDLFGCHLQDYIRAKELVSEQQTPPTAKWSGESGRLWKAYSKVATPHLATSSDAVELNYTRAVVDLLLHVLVPPPHLETNTGRFVVGELITCNVLLPLIAKLSDPDWLNSLMIEIFGRVGQPQESVLAEPQTPSLPMSPPPSQPELDTHDSQTNNNAPQLKNETEIMGEVETTTPELPSYDVVDAEEVDYTHNHAEEEEPSRPFLRHYVRGGKSNPFYQENDTDLDSPLGDYKSSSDSLVMFGQEDSPSDRQRDRIPSLETSNGLDLEDVCPSSGDGSCPKVLVNSQPLQHPSDCGRPSVRTGEGSPTVGSQQDVEREGASPSACPARELLLGVEQSGTGNPAEATEASPLQSSSPMPSFSFDPLSSPDGPVIIQNLRITGTITAKEHRGTGSHPYTLYTIKVST